MSENSKHVVEVALDALIKREKAKQRKKKEREELRDKYNRVVRAMEQQVRAGRLDDDVARDILAAARSPGDER